MLKKIAALAMALGIFAVQSLPALACGGLIAPDGDVRLQKATTLIAWHNGIEHYLTTFAYQGSSTNLGWIVPLPAVPIQIQDGGAWTLQRLEREANPVTLQFGAVEADAAKAPSAAVLEQVQIEALNITVIRGSGQEILNWAASNGFSVTGDTRSHLLIYAKASPIFMAAKFDASAAKARGQLQGDGTPILITMKTAHIWVPLEVLSLDAQVQADIFLLTDNPVYTSDFDSITGQSSVGSTVGNAQGFTMPFQEKMTPTLYHDLSTDRNMGWVWPDSWMTYLTLNAPSETVTYDMGVSTSGVIRLAPFGTPPMAVVDGQASKDLPAWVPRMPLGTPQFLISVEIVLIMLGVAFMIVRHRRRGKVQAGI
jgi:Uncharacterized protein conserved in bacteria (DUF2330)